MPIRGKKVPYGGMTTRSAISDFLQRKLAPAPQTMLDIISGETVMHQPITVMGEVGRLTVPLVVRDIYEVMGDLGVSAGIREGILAIFGEGLNTYGPKTEYVTGSAEERKKRFENDLEQMQWNSEPPAYHEYLTDEQMTQVDERREEKKRGVIAAATQKEPDRENYRSDKTYATGLKKREKAMERFRGMAKELGHAEAQQLLLEYWRRPGKKGKAGSELKEGTTHTKDKYRKQGVALAKLYGATTEKEASKDFWAWRNRSGGK